MKKLHKILFSRDVLIVFLAALSFYAIQRVIVLHGEKIKQLFVSSSLSGSSQIIPYNTVRLDSGYEYAIAKGKPSAPLVIIFAFHKELTFDRHYVPTSDAFLAAGFTVASVDVPCHGRDASPEENGMDRIACLKVRADRGIVYQPDIAKHVSAVIDDIVKKGTADARNVTVVGISRGVYTELWAALGDERIKNIVALAPLVDLLTLSEFRDYKGAMPYLNFDGYYRDFTKKNFFIQVSNRDDRIDTNSVLKLASNISYAVPAEKKVDLHLVMTSARGHVDTLHNEAAQWAKARVLPPLGYSKNQ